MGIRTSALGIAMWIGGTVETAQCPGQRSCSNLLPFLPGGIIVSSFPLSADILSQVKMKRDTLALPRKTRLRNNELFMPSRGPSTEGAPANGGGVFVIAAGAGAEGLPWKQDFRARRALFYPENILHLIRKPTPKT